MINLLKNVARSFKKNKLSICGLSFLVFLSTCIYTTLSGTTSAINSEYRYISKNGNLHDFTVSELYNVGVVRYKNDIEKVVVDPSTQDSVNSCLYEDNSLSRVRITYSDQEPEEIVAPYIAVTGTKDHTEYLANVSITYTIDVSNCDENASLKKFYLDSWLNHQDNPSETDTWSNHINCLEPTITYSIKISEEAFNYFSEKQPRYGKDYADDEPIELSAVDYNSYISELKINDNTQSALSTYSNDLYSIVGQENTLMSEYLAQKAGVGDFRNFISLNIDNSSDNIYYKVIRSTPNDTVDKLVHIDPNNGVNKTQWNNFADKDCTYDVLNYKVNDNWDINQTLRYRPNAIEENFDIHYIEKIFLLNKGDWTDNPGDFKGKITNLIGSTQLPTNNTARQEWWDSKKTSLERLLKDEKDNNEQVYCKDDRVTINWTNSQGVPSAWSISNWTSYFSVVNPEFLNKNNLHTLDPSIYNQEESYKQYVKNNQRITDQKMLFIGWMNSLDFPEFEKWFDSVCKNENYKNQFIIPGGASPYLIIGSGITPDFIYPIVSMERSTPNPNSECIFYVNVAGYGRIYDSFRNNLNENYIVGKFTSNNKKVQKTILNDINKYAAEVMIYPKGTQVAYFATDTNNVLNASSFRISYIPKFINVINLTSISLTLFIILLSLVICAIVIHRYITNQQSTLGIMRANGFSSKQIATSMLPFALLPVVVGTLAGVIVGTLLQFITLTLFSNYWMLPTQLLGFDWMGFAVIFVIALAIFISTVYFTSLYVLRKNTVDLMKNDSQNNPNLASRSMKRVFGKFGIMTKFRTAVAFSSMWKLFVLVVMTTLSLSTLVFTFSIKGKFANVTALTNQSRDYSYAVDLITPTTQGSQYVGINYGKIGNGNSSFGFAGLSGFNQAGNDLRDVNYVQSLYFGEPEENVTITTPTLPVTVNGLNLPGITYSTDSSNEYEKGYMPKIYDSISKEEHNLNFFLNKKYYFSSILFNYFNVNTNPGADVTGVNSYFDKYLDSFKSSSADALLSNLYLPFMGDSYGQQTDIFYLKDRMLSNSTLNYIVGMKGIAESNPWDIASSLMPDNNKKLLEKANQDFINYIGNAINYKDNESDKVYKQLHDLFVQDTQDEELLLYKKFIIPSQDIDGQDQYIINKTLAVGDHKTDQSKAGTFNVAIRPSFLNLLSTAYAYVDTAEKDYYVTYNTIPLLPEDETYTWINGSVLPNNSSAKILGIKTGEHASKYINLYDENKRNLNDGNNSLIRYTQADFESNYRSNGSWNYNFNKPFPIIANAYAAHKYNLKVGSEISFTINNRVDRYLDEINPHASKKHIANFVVKGICTTYEGEEYYIDQDVANLLLGLKTHLWDNETDNGQYIQSKYEPNAYYGYEYKTLQEPLRGGFDTPTSTKGISVEGGDDMLINLSNYEQDMINSGYNLTPYGFNGVFTKSQNGGPILTKGVVLYSITGLYPGNDRITSDVATNMLKYGANLEILRRVTLNGDDTTELGKGILAAYNEWVAEPNLNEREQKHIELEKFAEQAREFIRSCFGDQAYTLVVANVSDAFSSQLIYDNLSNTISNITYVVIAIVSLMVIIIVALITNMIINDSKRLASLLKALGYTDIENAKSFLSIYAPVIIFSLIIASLLSWGLLNIYNSLIFKGVGIWLNAQIKWYDYLISTGIVAIIFGISGLNSVLSLKRESLVDSIK